MVSTIGPLRSSETDREAPANTAMTRAFLGIDKWADMSFETNEISRCDLSKLKGLLQCRLNWYGLRSVKVGPLRELSQHTLLVDLLHACGVVLCRIEVDRRSGAIQRPANYALLRLHASLQRATTAHESPVVRPVAN